jgi:hypothetical protein
VTGAARALRAAAAAALTGAIACSSAPSASPTAPSACAGLQPPKLASVGAVTLPPAYVSGRIASNLHEEIVVGRDGTVSQFRLVAATVPELQPFARYSLERTRFTPAEIDGHRVAVRGAIVVPIGAQPRTAKSWRYDALSAFVPGGGSREALWQLAGSVDRLTLVAHVGTLLPRGGSIVAKGPDGVEKTLLAVPASSAELEMREIVKTGRFFDRAGDYAIELRGDRTLASTTVTIATGFETAVVNACEPLAGPEKTGPGR